MNVYLYVLDTLADWEIGYLTAELYSKRYFASKDTSCRMIKMSRTLSPITTMGGMKLIPDATLDSVSLQDKDMLVLPGGNTWFDPEQDAILELAKQRIENDMPVAAICGATAGLARVGALNSKKHTSNDVTFLKQTASQYTGSDNYIRQPVVNDRYLITASGSGLSALLFAYEILKTLKVFNPDTLEAWKNLNMTNDEQYFYKMMETITTQG